MQANRCAESAFISVTMKGYDALTRWRNSEDTKACTLMSLGRRVMAEPGYALLALIGLVETFVRFLIATVIALTAGLLSGFECGKNLRQITGNASSAIGVSWLATCLGAGALFSNIYQSKIPISEKFIQK
jgi:hypothetical protein